MKTRFLIAVSVVTFLVSACQKTDKNTDTVKPVMTLNGKVEDYVLYPNPYVDPGATATDNKDGDITAKITVINHLDYAHQNLSYDIQYAVKDAAGNLEQKQRIVGFVNPTKAYAGQNGNLSWSDSLIFFSNDSLHIRRFAGIANASVRALLQNDSTFTIPQQTVTCGSPAAPHVFSGTGTIAYAMVYIKVKINYTQLLNGSTTTGTISY